MFGTRDHLVDPLLNYWKQLSAVRFMFRLQFTKNPAFAILRFVLVPVCVFASNFFSSMPVQLRVRINSYEICSINRLINPTVPTGNSITQNRLKYVSIEIHLCIYPF